MSVLTIDHQISPEVETCWRCVDLGLPGVIPAGEEYIRIANGTIAHDACADCWNRLSEDCRE